MLAWINGLVVDGACAVLGLHTTEQLRLAAHRVDVSWQEIADEQEAAIARLRALLEAAAPKRVSAAVDAVCCPQCGAQRGERCRYGEGAPPNRTHKARVESWRAMQAAEAEAAEAEIKRLRDEPPAAPPPRPACFGALRLHPQLSCCMARGRFDDCPHDAECYDGWLALQPPRGPAPGGDREEFDF